MKTSIRGQRGFTLIELVVVMVIVALLSAVAVPKFIDLQKQAEAASVKKVLGNLRSALSLRVAQALVDGDNLADLAYDGATPLNPMNDLLSNKPESYIGVVSVNQPADPNGVWFDRNVNAADRWVMYKLKNEDIITTTTGAAGGGWASNGKNIIHRIEAIVEGGEVVGLELTATPTYDYDWAH